MDSGSPEALTASMRSEGPGPMHATTRLEKDVERLNDRIVDLNIHLSLLWVALAIGGVTLMSVVVWLGM